MQERNADALAIARDAAELHKTVQDLNELVNEQGESVAKVEENVDSALDKVVAGTQDLEVAQKYVSSYRKKCCFFGFLFLGLIAAIVVPLVLHYKGQLSINM